MSPTGDAAYVSLMAVGKLLKLDARTGAVIGEAEVGPRPRGIAVSHDGKDVYVTRFISPDSGRRGRQGRRGGDDGRDAHRAQARQPRRWTAICRRAAFPTICSPSRSRPTAGRRGSRARRTTSCAASCATDRDLTHDTTVRPLAAVIDTLAAQEIYRQPGRSRRSQPAGARRVQPVRQLRDPDARGLEPRRDSRRQPADPGVLGDRRTWGRSRAPRCWRRTGACSCRASLSRNVLVYDLSVMLKDFAQSTPPQVAAIPTVASEKLPAAGARGKEDLSQRRRHPHGVRGLPQLRRVPLRGRSTTGASAISARAARACGTRWRCSAASRDRSGPPQLDRHARRGAGLRAPDPRPVPGARLHAGRHLPRRDARSTARRSEGRPQPGAGRAGRVRGLARSREPEPLPQPGRLADGRTASPARRCSSKLGCDFCHGGAEFTDSARGVLHDVGTITALSGTRAGGATARHRHADPARRLGDAPLPSRRVGADAARRAHHQEPDRSARLRQLAVVAADRPAGRLPPADRQRAPVRPLPFDAPLAGVDGGISGDGGPPPSADRRGGGGCGCDISTGGRRFRVEPGARWVWLCLAMMRRRRRRPRRPGADRLAAAGVAVGVDVDWTRLCPSSPAAATTRGAHRLVEAAGGDGRRTASSRRSAMRDGTYERICARGRGDSFAKALCDGGRRPEIRDLAGAARAGGPGERRAFALTGNSTSLVAKSVSAINPRMLVFPRVERRPAAARHA